MSTVMESKHSVLILMTATALLTPVMSSSINIALPTIGDDFKLSAVTLSWVASSYLLSTAVFLLPFGRAADLYGRRRVFLCGMWTFTFASLLCAFAGSGMWLLVYRVLQGIGSAMMFGTSTAILTAAFPPGERGRALGINVAAVYAGLSAGPFIGGFLTQHLGWQSIFLIHVPVGLAIILLTHRTLAKDPPERKPGSFDLQGAFLYAVVLLSIMFGITLLPHIPGGSLIVVGVLGTGVFIWWELQVETPLLDVSLFRTNRVFAFSNLAALLNYSATAAIAFLMSLYLQIVKGLTPEQAGLILVAQPVVQTALSPFAGSLSDRREPQVVASLGMGLTAVGLGGFSFLSPSSSYAFIVAILALLGSGFALFSSPNTNAIMSSVERTAYGVASSAVATMRLVGQMLSMGFVTLIFSLVIGQIRLTPSMQPELLSSVRIAFALFSVLCLTGVFASLARGRMREA